MNTDVVSVSLSTTYRQLESLLAEFKHTSFPLVDQPGSIRRFLRLTLSPESRVLLGSVHRMILRKVLDEQRMVQRRNEVGSHAGSTAVLN